MRLLKNTIYIIFALTVMVSCEKETTLLENSEITNQKTEVSLDIITTGENYNPNCIPPILNSKNKSLNSRGDDALTNIALYGSNKTSWITFFNSNGYNATYISQSTIENGDLLNYDVLYLLRNFSYNSNTLAQIKSFINNGGILISEYTATIQVLFNVFETNLATGYRPGNRNSVINVNMEHPMSFGLPSSFSGGGQVDYYYSYDNLDSDFNIFASFNQDLNNDGENDPVGGTYCYGEGVYVAFFTDFADLYDSSSSEALTLSINMIEYAIASCNLTDRDDDGVLNEEDPYPNSNTSAELSFDGCYPDVTNTYMGNGTYMADEVDAIIAAIWDTLNSGNHRRNYDPQQQFQKEMITLLNKWYRNDRIVTDREKFQITKCVRSSRIFDTRTE